MSQICETAGCGKTIVYQRRAEWLKKYDVDIAIPFAFYRDLRVYAPASFMIPQDHDALLNARSA